MMLLFRMELRQMTKEEWKQAEEDLKFLFKTVKLNCDGYELALSLQRLDTYRNVIVFYVNGVFNGKWLLEDCEERRRFFRKEKRSLLTAKGKAQFKKLSKKKQAEWSDKFFYDVYTPYWTSFKSLKKHLTQNNESIELIKS